MTPGPDIHLIDDHEGEPGQEPETDAQLPSIEQNQETNGENNNSVEEKNLQSRYTAVNCIS